ncbi:MAG: hypothetical protein PVI25_00740 [Gammaproteobacteria bacterium]
MSRYEGQADFFFDDRFFLVVVFRRTGFLFTVAFFLGAVFFLDAVFLREPAFFLLAAFFLADAFLREAGFFRLTAFFLAAGFFRAAAFFLLATFFFPVAFFLAAVFFLLTFFLLAGFFADGRFAAVFFFFLEAFFFAGRFFGFLVPKALSISASILETALSRNSLFFRCFLASLYICRTRRLSSSVIRSSSRASASICSSFLTCFWAALDPESAAFSACASSRLRRFLTLSAARLPRLISV